MTRPLSAEALWAQRYKRAEAKLSLEQRRRHHGLMLEVIRVLGQETSVIPGKGWGPNPTYRDAAEERRLWCEIGALLGIGPPPRSWSGMRSVPRREPEGALPLSAAG